MRFALFFLLWVMLTLVFGLVSPLLLASTRATHLTMRYWNQCTLWLARHVAGMRLQVEGRAQMASGGAAVYASAHQSALDTFALWLLLDNPAFVLKKELLRIPIFGWFLARTQPIAIDRAAGASAVEQIAQQAQSKLAQGRHIVIFPQGTRQPVGAPPAYKSGGIWALYALGYPVIPVALNTGRLWPKHGRKRAGVAVIRLMPALPSGLSKDALMQQLQAACECVR